MADYWRSEYVSNQLSLILLRFALVLCNMSILLVWGKIFWYHFWLQRTIYSSLCGKIYQRMKETFYGLTEILKLWILPQIWLKISTFFKDWSYHCKANKFEPLIIPGITFCCLYLSFLFFASLEYEDILCDWTIEYWRVSIAAAFERATLRTLLCTSEKQNQ